MQLKTELFPYQSEGVEKLRRLRIGALYMEMGTGKTRTALELIAIRMNAGKIDHVIWMAPCSAMRDIRNNIAYHSDLTDEQLTMMGIETLSTSVRENSRMRKLVAEKRVFLVVDESSFVKNPEALRTKNITTIAMGCPYRLILNGTAISKNYADLFSQWYLLDWRILGYRSFYSFSANHIEYDKENPTRIRRCLNVDYLTEKIEPYTFQALKAEVFTGENQIPEKIYDESGFWMTDEQERNFDKVTDHFLALLDDRKPETLYQMFTNLQAITSGYHVSIDSRGRTKRNLAFGSIEDNPRFKCLLDNLPSDEKAIIFCTYKDEILGIANALNSRSPGSAVAFYGEISKKNRQKIIDEFRGDAQYFVSSKRCGSFALNLQFCHNIIYYAQDWDYGTRMQSEDRVHRIGQQHKVNIVDIYASGTIDVRMMRCIAKKENLADSFKCQMKQNAGTDKLKKFIRGERIGKDLP